MAFTSEKIQRFISFTSSMNKLRYLLGLSFVGMCALVCLYLFPSHHQRLTDDSDVIALMEAFRKEKRISERTRYAVAIQKRIGVLLDSGTIRISPIEMRQTMGEPNEVYESAPCASNAWYYWFSADSRTNGLLAVWWQTSSSGRINRLADVFVATIASEWE